MWDIVDLILDGVEKREGEREGERERETADPHHEKMSPLSLFLSEHLARLLVDGV